jgi:hypothetical protein
MQPSKKVISALAIANATKLFLDKCYKNRPYSVNQVVESITKRSSKALDLYRHVNISEKDIQKIYEGFIFVDNDKPISVCEYCSYVIGILNDIIIHIKDKERREALENVQSSMQKLSNYFDPKMKREDEYASGLGLTSRFNEYFGE